MPRTYVRKSTKTNDEATIERALTEINEGPNSIRAASKELNMPFEPLRRRMKNPETKKRFWKTNSADPQMKNVTLLKH